jgi:hypothetical protein
MLSSYVPSAAYRWGEDIAVPIRDLSTRGVGAQQEAPAALLPEEELCAHCAGWVSRPVWMSAENVPPPYRGSNPAPSS